MVFFADPKAAGGQLKQEIQKAVKSLDAYVATARERFDNPSEQLGGYSALDMELKSKELEQQREVAVKQAAEINYLREVSEAATATSAQTPFPREFGEVKCPLLRHLFLSSLLTPL